MKIGEGIGEKWRNELKEEEAYIQTFVFVKKKKKLIHTGLGGPGFRRGIFS